MNIGYKLIDARKKANLSQKNLAEKVGVTPQAISTWKRNENIPDDPYIKLWADGYNIMV